MRCLVTLAPLRSNSTPRLPIWTSKSVRNLGTGNGAAALAKDVIAIANFGGGHIVFGKRDDGRNGFDWVGLSEDDLAELEVTRLNRVIGEYLDPAIDLEPQRVYRAGLVFVVVRVPATSQLVMAARQNDAARLFTGRISEHAHGRRGIG